MGFCFVPNFCISDRILYHIMSPVSELYIMNRNIRDKLTLWNKMQIQCVVWLKKSQESNQGLKEVPSKAHILLGTSFEPWLDSWDFLSQTTHWIFTSLESVNLSQKSQFVMQSSETGLIMWYKNISNTWKFITKWNPKALGTF